MGTNWPKDTLVGRVISFSRALRHNGVSVGSSQVIDACRSLALIDICCRNDFYWALRVNLISGEADAEKFNRLFPLFFEVEVEKSRFPGQGPAVDSHEAERPAHEGSEASLVPTHQEQERTVCSLTNWTSDEASTFEQGHIGTYSPYEAVVQKDFAQYTSEELILLRYWSSRLARELSSSLSRRTRHSLRRKRLDWTRILRRSIRYGGEILTLVGKSRKHDRTRLVFLCDVSGSMELYTRFIFIFLYALKRQVPGLEVFVFSTRLTKISRHLRCWKWWEEDALTKLGNIVPGWQGGTRIGECLQAFLAGEGKVLLKKDTVVIIISDGWDVGDIKVLERALAELKRRSRCLLWLNPLMGSPNFEPTCMGMQVAVRHVDALLPLYNIMSLRDMVAKLAHFLT